jgi:antitoxin component of MazEF toxin-antitoxin module
MKSKVTEWGNSHGIRITSAMMEHLNVAPGEEIEIHLTDRGLEIVKNDRSVEYVKSVAQEVLDAILESTDPVRQVSDPYAQIDVDYLVVAIDPCKPLIREVPKGTANAHQTLADAKEAARQVLQSTIAEAKASLADLRQLGIDNIHYITLG